MKMESELPSAWEKLAAACRKSRAGLLPVNEEAPFGFAQRIAAQSPGSLGIAEKWHGGRSQPDSAITA